MAEKKSSGKQAAKDQGSYSVSSANKGPGKTVSFTVPTFPKPDLNKLRSTPKPARRTWLAVLIVIVLAIGGGYVGAWLQNDGTSINSGSLSNQKKIVTSQSQLISQIAKTVGPSVVSVNVNITSASSQTDFFGFSQPAQQAQAAGTGIIISSEGLVITNRHVVPTGTTKVSVTLSDGTELKDVTVLGRTNSSDSLDVAFLKINNTNGHKLEAAALGNSSQVQVGDAVVAIGNALGQFQNTVTSGIISGYGRSVVAGDSSGQSSSTENLDNLFQTDAAINEGNSGGPLVNMNGQVIGINTAIAGNAQNIGFAIPINDVKGLVDQVVSTGKFARPYLGVRYVPLTADVAKEYDLKVTSGAYVVPSADPATTPSVLPDSPADKAGLQERDIITEVDGKKVDQNHSLTSLLSQHKPGDKVELTVVRGDDTKHITVTLGTMPTEQDQ